jgi:hypothetical protein
VLHNSSINQIARLNMGRKSRFHEIGEHKFQSTTDGTPMGAYGSYGPVTLSIGGDNVAVAWMLQNGQQQIDYFSNSAIEAGQEFIPFRSIPVVYGTSQTPIIAVTPDGSHIAYSGISDSREWFLGLYSGMDGSLLLDMSDLGREGSATTSTINGSPGSR